MNLNPYESPVETERESLTLSRLIAVVHFAALASPLLLLAGVYGAWMLAWAILGHPPRPSLDDPAQVLGAAYYVSGVPVVLVPPGSLVGLLSIVLLPWSRRSPAQKGLWIVLVVGLWAGVIGLLRWDPLQVGQWWMD